MAKNTFSNRFSVLQMDSDTDSCQSSDRTPSPHTPPYPPTYGDTPRAHVKVDMDTVEDNRFRTWAQDSVTKNNATLFGRNKKSHVYMPHTGVRMNAITLLNTSSNVQFPSLGHPPSNTPMSSANTWRESFARKVLDMAERECTQEELARAERKKVTHTNILETYPITNRFRRTLEDILAEEEDDNNYDDGGTHISDNESYCNDMNDMTMNDE